MTQVLNEMLLRIAINTKPILTNKEAALYLGISIKTLYNWTNQGKIPYYKPQGMGSPYFKREELETLICDERFRVKSNTEIQDEAKEYLFQHKEKLS